MRTRKFAGSRLALAAALAALVALSPALAGLAAAKTATGWTISASPTALVFGQLSHVRLTIKDTSTILTGGGNLACVVIKPLPARTEVSAITLTSASSGKHWSGQVQNNTLEFSAVKGSDVLNGSLLGLSQPENAVFDLRVTGLSNGNATWPAQGYRDKNCSSQDAGSQPTPITFTVSGGATPTPSPKPKPSADPTPSPKPKPSADPTPSPKPAPSADSTPSPKPAPSVVPTPSPTAPPVPGRTAAPSSVPTAAPSSGSTPTAAGTPTPTPSVTPTLSPGPSVSPTAPAATPPTGAGVLLPGGDQGPGGQSGGPIAWTGVAGFDVALNGATTADAIAGDFGGFSAILDWAVPTALMTVPGLLLLLVVGAQMGGGLVWLPVARRTLGGFGLRRRRRA